MLHGHCHGNLSYPFVGRIMDAGVDPRGYFPISYEQVKAHMSKIKPIALDHHMGD
jgi:calcineurin-like phosphoesterase family protein